jgi:asparagine synthase (glutamine-hydrolysing)
MSVQFGILRFDRRRIDPELARRYAAMTAEYGPDGTFFCEGESFALHFQFFRITKADYHEQQPRAGSNGIVLLWDGRLDNRMELAHALGVYEHSALTDADMVLAAYERWGTGCFARLLGDWAMAVVDSRQRTVFLAKDFIGTRRLFYRYAANQVLWSSVLDPLVFLSDRSPRISEEFVGGYLSDFPEAHLTPFQGISAVPPGSFLQLRQNGVTKYNYWHVGESAPIHYPNDAEYEEHFRQLFATAVRRRLRSCHPVLAELSGGMDSSAIVCVAHQLLAREQFETPRLDTISYYDDDEPNCDERAHFTVVEKWIARQGYHINLSNIRGAFLPPLDNRLFPLPGIDRLAVERARQMHECLQISQSRVVLSGIGGDEFLGGVPTPVPELQDLASKFRWFRFASQLSRFCLYQRRPLLHLAFDGLEEFLPQFVRVLYKRPPAPSWLDDEFVRRHPQTFRAAPRTKLLSLRPSLQAATATIDHIRRQLHCLPTDPAAPYQVSYPCLDRDLIEFVSCLPRDQLVRPGQRRSLMRRALHGLMPPEILARKQKSFVVRQPIEQLKAARDALGPVSAAYHIAENSWINPERLSSELQSACRASSGDVVALHRTLKLELWIRMLLDQTRRQTAAPYRIIRNAQQRQDSTQRVEYVKIKEENNAV